MAITLSDIRELVEKLREDSELQLTFARAFLTEPTVRALMQSDPQLREALRNAVLTEELLRMPAQLRSLNETVERIEQRVERVEKDVAEVKTDIAGVKEDVAEVKTDLAGVKEDVAEVKTDLAGVKEDVAEVKTDLAGVKEDVAEVKTDLAGVKEDVAEVKTDLAGVKEDVAEVKTDLAGVKEDVAEVKTDLAGVKEDVAEVKTDLAGVKEDVAEVKTDLAGVKEDVAEVKTGLTSVKEELSQTKTYLDQRISAVENRLNGLEGRLAGEDFERRTVARAARILGVGEGGSPREDPAVRQRLLQWLVQGGVLEEDGDEESEPLWADLIWWKGDRVVVAEISIKVNGIDVTRAKRRAETLRQAGVDAIPVVIGKEWAHPETVDLAKHEGVEWAVGGNYSEGLIAFRRG